MSVKDEAFCTIRLAKLLALGVARTTSRTMAVAK
jgi:hypothetical protein